MTQVVPLLVPLQLLSLTALLLEELVPVCASCIGLYTFEFFSCSAFLFTLLLLVLLATPLHTMVGISKWPVLVSLVFIVVLSVTEQCLADLCVAA